jgi:hypothetical protein
MIKLKFHRVRGGEGTGASAVGRLGDMDRSSRSLTHYDAGLVGQGLHEAITLLLVARTRLGSVHGLLRQGFVDRLHLRTKGG